LSEKLVSTFADKKCCVVSATDTYRRIVGFLDRPTVYRIKKQKKWPRLNKRCRAIIIIIIIIIIIWRTEKIA
jgi:hypothetical protein